MNNIVSATKVAFEFPNGCKIFDQLNFSINNSITALVGPNGVGKTTLAKLISGQLLPTSGEISLNTVVTYFEQQIDPPNVSIDEFLNFEYDWSLFKERLLYKIDRSSLCNELSGGQWNRVRLAKELSQSFLILDEPTNNLDRFGRETVLEFIREHKNGILLISHDRECLKLCDEVIELSNTGLNKFGDTWSNYINFRNSERQRLNETLVKAKINRDLTAQNRNLQKLKQEKRNLQGAKNAKKGGMPKILIGARKRRAQQTTASIDISTLEKVNAAVAEAHAALSDTKFDPQLYADLNGIQLPNQRLIAHFKDFNVYYRDWVFARDLNIHWQGNIRLAIKGPNGCGKSTLIKSLLEAPLNVRGDLIIGKFSVVYVDQQYDGLDFNKSIIENMREVANMSEVEIRNILAKFLFTKNQVFQQIASLSGGEKLRAALAKGFFKNEKPDLLILDEPTNNLDLSTVEYLEKFILNFAGAVILISHDEVFINNCRITEELNL